MAQARIAVTDLYPRISLAGNIALSARPDRLGDDGAVGFAVGPSLIWGLFDMPRLLRRVKSADARSEAALAQWQAVVLAALEESDSALEAWNSSRWAANEAELPRALPSKALNWRQFGKMRVRFLLVHGWARKSKHWMQSRPPWPGEFRKRKAG